MNPTDIAKILNYRGPAMFQYVRSCMTLAPNGLTVSKVEAFMKNPERDPVTDEQLAFLTDCVKQRFVKVEEYDPHTGNAVRSGMVRIASTKSAEPLIMAPKGTTLADDPRLAAFLGKNYAVGQGNTLGMTTEGKPVTVDGSAAAERRAIILANEARAAEALAVKNGKPGKVKTVVQSLMTFGRPPTPGALA